MAEEKVIFIGYIEQPGIVDVQNLYQHAKRKNAESIIVYKNEPTEKVVEMAKQKGHQMVPADDFKGEAKKLEEKYKADHYTVFLKDLTEIRDSMRDVGI